MVIASFLAVTLHHYMSGTSDTVSRADSPSAAAAEHKGGEQEGEHDNDIVQLVQDGVEQLAGLPALARLVPGVGKGKAPG